MDGVSCCPAQERLGDSAAAISGTVLHGPHPQILRIEAAERGSRRIQGTQDDRGRKRMRVVLFRRKEHPFFTRLAAVRLHLAAIPARSAFRRGRGGRAALWKALRLRSSKEVSAQAPLASTSPNNMAWPGETNRSVCGRRGDLWLAPSASGISILPGQFTPTYPVSGHALAKKEIRASQFS